MPCLEGVEATVSIAVEIEKVRRTVAVGVDDHAALELVARQNAVVVVVDVAEILVRIGVRVPDRVPKAGTVAPDVINAVKEYANGKQEYRNDDGGNVHGVIGKLSFADAKLAENLEAFIANINKVKPSSSKGTYIKKCVIAACMSPGVQVAV
jgi:large subunit ribosomal protein L1